MLICVTFSLPPSVGGWLRLLLAALPGLFCLPFWISLSDKEFSVVTVGPRQANLVLITYASSEGSGEPAHLRSLARTFAARSYKQ